MSEELASDVETSSDEIILQELIELRTQVGEIFAENANYTLDYAFSQAIKTSSYQFKSYHELQQKIDTLEASIEKKRKNKKLSENA